MSAVLDYNNLNIKMISETNSTTCYLFYYTNGTDYILNNSTFNLY